MIFVAVAVGILVMTAVVYLLMRQPKPPASVQPDEIDPSADKGDA